MAVTGEWVATCQQSCEQRDRVSPMEQGEEFASLLIRSLVREKKRTSNTV